MPGQQVPIVFFPRFSSFVGAGSYRGFPIDVTQYDRAEITVWRGALVGTSPTFQFRLFASFDRESWTQIEQGDPGEGLEMVVAPPLSQPWLRGAIILSGTAVGVTCWMQGFLRKREE